MYALLQTTQSPFQFDWCSAGLGQYITGVGVSSIYHLAPTSNATGGVYLNSSGAFSGGNVYTNNKGTLTYSLVKTGQTTGTITTSPPYNDNVSSSAITTGITNYALTIKDGGNGQSFLFNNSITWGGI
jgi:hypothetical protein